MGPPRWALQKYEPSCCVTCVCPAPPLAALVLDSSFFLSQSCTASVSGPLRFIPCTAIRSAHHVQPLLSLGGPTSQHTFANVMNFLLDLLDCLVRLIRWLFGLLGASHSENVPQSDPPSSPTSTSPPLLREKSSFILTPETDDRSCTALQNLQQGLKRYRLESCVDRHLEFVAGPIVQRLVEDNIKTILEEGSLGDVEHISSHCQLISKHATRLFAIFVELKREEYIIPLLKDGIQDDNLPFQRVQTSTQHTMVLVTRQGTNVHALKDWDNEAIKNLEKKQYRVLSPIFRRGEHYELDDLHILPFLNHEADHGGKASAAGGYGEVFRACIHPDNHELEHSSVRPRRVSPLPMLLFLER